MSADRLIHDAAWAMATALMDVVGHCFREEEQRDLFAEFYRACRAGIEAFCIHADRQQQRLRPGKN